MLCLALCVISRAMQRRHAPESSQGGLNDTDKQDFASEACPISRRRTGVAGSFAGTVHGTGCSAAGTGCYACECEGGHTAFGPVCAEISGQGQLHDKPLACRSMLANLAGIPRYQASAAPGSESAVHRRAQQAAHRENTNLLSAVQGNPLEVIQLEPQ
jgi:hypothetical protein